MMRHLALATHRTRYKPNRGLATSSAAYLTRALLWLSLVCVGTAGAKTPSVSYLVPAGAQRGTTVKVRCNGDFDWPLKVFSPHARIRCLEEKGKLSVELSDQLVADRVWIRFYNDQGASALLPFLVGSLPEVEEAEPNNRRDDAQLLVHAAADETSEADGETEIYGVETIVNGRLEKSGDHDTFRVRLKKGQTLVADVDANAEFGSPIDAILQIVSTRGDVLSENHDTVGLDPRIVFTAPATGDYLIRLFAFPSNPNTRIQYHGGADCVYRLVVTTGTYVTHTVPSVLAFQAPAQDDDEGGKGTAVRGMNVTLGGWNLPTDRETSVHPSTSLGRLANLEVEARSADRYLPLNNGIGFLTLPTGGRQRVRLVPNLAPQSGDEFELPCVVDGVIREPGAIASYNLRLKKGEKTRISVESTSLGFELAPRIQLLDGEGKLLKKAAFDGAAKDMLLDFAAPETMVCRLAIQDHFGGGSSQHRFRLSAFPIETDYSLQTKSDALKVPFNGEAELEVGITREVGTGDPVGDVRIQAIGLPLWVQCEPVVSKPDGETSKKVKLTFRADGLSFAGPIQIQGTTEDGRVRFAETPARYGASFKQLWLTVD